MILTNFVNIQNLRDSTLIISVLTNTCGNVFVFFENVQINLVKR